MTCGLPGPGILSDRPRFPGSLVHYRFGAFSGVRVLDNDGTRSAMVVAPDGTLVPDQGNPWFSPPPWAPRDPFTCGSTRARPTVAGPKFVLLYGRYLVREVIRHSFAGGVYRAMDEATGSAVIVKQARPHAAATLLGTDICDVRRHEAALLERFSTSGLTPRPHGMFEQQGDVFLVEEAIWDPHCGTGCGRTSGWTILIPTRGACRRRPPSGWLWGGSAWWSWCTPRAWCCGTSTPGAVSGMPLSRRSTGSTGPGTTATSRPSDPALPDRDAALLRPLARGSAERWQVSALRHHRGDRDALRHGRVRRAHREATQVASLSHA